MILPKGPGPVTAQQRAIAQRLAKGQESLLLDYLRKLENHRQGRRAVVVRLSALQAANRRDHHVRMAAAGFEDVVRQLKGQIFILADSDLVLIFKETALDEVEAQIVKLRFMFDDDSFLAGEGAAGRPAFVDWFLLDRDYETLVLFAQRAVTEEQQRRESDSREPETERVQVPQMPKGDPLTPALLAKVEEHLANANLANMLRRQAICAIVGKASPQPVLYELFISIADLRQTLMPDTDLASSPWLFQQLTRTLDRRVLSLLNKHDDSTIAGDISINLNVETLLSQEFLNFDDNIKASERGSIVIELQKTDVFADLGAFLFARDFAHDRGYRICIDGADLESLPFISRDKLGVDFIKLVWSPEMIMGQFPDGSRLEDYVRRAGATRIMLCRCGEQAAIDYGQTLGITLFQGYHVEALRLADDQQKGKNGSDRWRERRSS
ncbi:MAG: hypothetical protein VB101_03690 [Rhodospirillaceae bacterium]|nr:hypothetical protein [Rhodospirillaceae bacterium]